MVPNMWRLHDLPLLADQTEQMFLGALGALGALGGLGQVGNLHMEELHVERGSFGVLTGKKMVGFHQWGYPFIAGWCIFRGKSHLWMRTGGSPILGHPQMREHDGTCAMNSMEFMDKTQ